MSYISRTIIIFQIVLNTNNAQSCCTRAAYRQFKNIYRPHWSGGLSPACPPLNFTFPQLYIHYPAPWWSIETQSGLWLLKTDHVTWILASYWPSRLDQSDHRDQQQGRNSESSVSKSDWAASSNVIIEIYHRSVSAVTILHAARFLSAEIQYPESLKSVWQENAEINFNIFVRNVRFRVS